MSRILVLLPSVPAPMDSGARIRNAGLMRLLAFEHEVDAVAFGNAQAASGLGGLARRWCVIEQPRPRPALRRARQLVSSSLPDMAHRLWSPVFMAAVRGFLADGEYAAVQAEGIEMARYLQAVAPGRRIYDAHNAEFLLQHRFSQSAPTLTARVYSRLQWRRLERFEGQIVRGSRMTLAVSNHDANQLLALAGTQARLRVLPNAIDASTYTFSIPDAQQAPNLLFVGKLDFRPNADAMRWFVDHVLSALPSARLFVVGAAPPSWLVRAGQHDDRLAVTGHVADERPYLRRCAALVLPLRTAGGSRLKALVAMACGVPIVSTRVGMEGLEAEAGVHFVAAESAAEWVAALRQVLSDAGLRARLAAHGRELVERQYEWSVLGPTVRDAYNWLDE